MKRVKKSVRSIPMFLIDRTKSETYPYDFFVVTHNAFPFIGRFRYFENEEEIHQYMAYELKVGNDYAVAYITFQKGYIAAIAESFLTDVEWNEEMRKKVVVQLRKVVDKYKYTK